MYLAFYGLNKEPFNTTPDPNFLYLSPSHKEALGAIIYGIEQRKGFIAITGEIGVGKTTIIRAYLERPTSRKQKTIYIFNPVLSFHGLLTTIFRSLDITPVSQDVAEMVNQLHEVLVAEYRANSTVVLVIDEAQNMPIGTLENLRMLSNLETPTDKLIQVVLSGQPELNTLLEQPNLRAFQQRIVLRATICPLTQKESQAYIEHRISLASTTQAPIFTNEAIKLITREAQGIPRRINILCDNALITGYGKQRKPVSANEVREIIADLDVTRTHKVSKWAIGAAVAMLLAIGSFFLGSFLLPNTIGNWLHSPFKGTGAASNISSIKPSEEETEGMQVKGETPASSLFQETGSFVGDRGQKVQEDQPKTPEKTVETSLSNVALHKEGYTNNQGLLRPDNGNNPHETTGSLTSKNGKMGNLTRTVQKGESLSQITNETYGSPSKEYIEWVQRHNPTIVNPDLILPGQKIVLPEHGKN